MLIHGFHLQGIGSPGKDDFACWHPDGKRIFHVSEVKGKVDIYSTSVEDIFDDSTK